MEEIHIINNQTFIINKNIILGFGVDGFVYQTKLNNLTIATKIMKNIFFTEQELNNFIHMNNIASNLEFGPKIYFIKLINNLIYIFMEKLDYTLTQRIEYYLSLGFTINKIKIKINNLLTPLFLSLISNCVTVGDNNTDNYMFINNQIKKIDYVNCVQKQSLNKSDIKKYSYIYVKINNQMHKFFINTKFL